MNCMLVEKIFFYRPCHFQCGSLDDSWWEYITVIIHKKNSHLNNKTYKAFSVYQSFLSKPVIARKGEIRMDFV